MSLSLKDFEIMAPVGSRESLAAAIQAGADSIYFGIENLNMRVLLLIVINLFHLRRMSGSLMAELIGIGLFGYVLC